MSIGFYVAEISDLAAINSDQKAQFLEFFDVNKIYQVELIRADIVVIGCSNNELPVFSIHLQRILVRTLRSECSDCSSSTVSYVSSTEASTDKIDICWHINRYVRVTNLVNLVINHDVFSSPSLRASRVTLKLSWMHILLVSI